MALVVKVPPGKAFVVERLGKYHRTLGTGTHLLTPVVDVVRAKVDLSEHSFDFPPQPAITADNTVTTVAAAIAFRVADPVKATYEIANFLLAIEQLTITVLRNRIGSMTAQEAIDGRAVLSEELLTALSEAERWGVEVSRAEITSITSPESAPDRYEWVYTDLP
jgi:regulator of protease activity HflC (stomatin/prohibitin superfamily)